MPIVFILCLLLLALAILYAAGPRSFVGGRTRVKDLKAHPRSKSEAHVIKLFETITGAKFPTVYPDWLKYKGKSLELDGYNKKLRIAVEFSGPQHTKYYPARETYASYLNRLENDRAKIEICRANGVALIVIDMSIPRDHLADYIKSRLWDVKFLNERPFRYLPEKNVEPWEVTGES